MIWNHITELKACLCGVTTDKITCKGNGCCASGHNQTSTIKPGNNGARKKVGVGEIILMSAKYIWASCFTHS